MNFAQVTSILTKIIELVKLELKTKSHSLIEKFNSTEDLIFLNRVVFALFIFLIIIHYCRNRIDSKVLAIFKLIFDQIIAMITAAILTGLNSSLLILLKILNFTRILKFKSFLLKERNDKSNKNNSVIKIIKKRKNTKNIFCIYCLLSIPLVANLLSVLVHKELANSSVTYISLTVIILLALETISFNYRVTKGLYGSNEFKVREIIKFILHNSDEIDFTGGGKLRKPITSLDDIEKISGSTNIKLPPLPDLGF